MPAAFVCDCDDPVALLVGEVVVDKALPGRGTAVFAVPLVELAVVLELADVVELGVGTCKTPVDVGSVTKVAANAVCVFGNAFCCPLHI